MSMAISSRRLDTPLGALYLAACEEGVCALRRWRADDREEVRGHAALLDEATAQIDAYLHGRREAFDLPLSLCGTAFEREVWTALRQVPYGKTESYAGIAARIGRERACRAVGRACGRNPVLILVPCHRIVASSGALTGFAAGLEMKRALLKLEQNGLK